MSISADTRSISDPDTGGCHVPQTLIAVIIDSLRHSKLFKDSFWAVFGNGVGNAMMLLAGILIARFLGKDLYGEYGVVKTTMFYVAAFATFGLGFTSTKYVAQYVSTHREYVRSIIRDAMAITMAFSGAIAILLMAFARPLADYVGAPSLSLAFRALAVVIVFKAVATTQTGVLSGFKDFKVVARNTCLSGVFMIVTCVPLTYFGGLRGSLLALALSQAFNAFINHLAIRRLSRQLDHQVSRDFRRELFRFSLPVALQESSFTVCHWTAVMLLTKYASVGELGMYSAGAQWNSIILMIPSLLSNVVLSYLAGSLGDRRQHSRTVRLMLLVNLITTLLPFAFVYAFAGFIASFYGPTFVGLASLMRIMTFTTILESCSSVFKSELMAQGRTWLLFTLRFLRDLIFVAVVYLLLSRRSAADGAHTYAMCSVAVGAAFFVVMWLVYIIPSKQDNG